MPYFFDTIETVPDHVGFAHFSNLHLVWIILGLVFIVCNCIWYRKMDADKRRRWRRTVALLIVADELFKVTMLLIGGRYNATYLPLHLCSINIFLIAWHAWKPTDLLSGFLYTVCIPGALAALLFPTWTSLPLGNFMHIHSFTIHILLLLYPVVITLSGEWVPEVRKLHRYLAVLVAMAVPITAINIWLDTNFMFLMEAEEGNPLYYFEKLWGNHLWGFPILIFAVLFVMYVPVTVYRIIKNNKMKSNPGS